MNEVYICVCIIIIIIIIVIIIMFLKKKVCFNYFQIVVHPPLN